MSYISVRLQIEYLDSGSEIYTAICTLRTTAIFPNVVSQGTTGWARCAPLWRWYRGSCLVYTSSVLGKVELSSGKSGTQFHFILAVCWEKWNSAPFHPSSVLGKVELSSGKSGTQFHSSQQCAGKSGTQFHLSQQCAGKSGTQFHSSQQCAGKSGTQFH